MRFVKVANDNEFITDEMREHYERRTRSHIASVGEYCRKIVALDKERWGELLQRAEVHDQSKFEEPEYTPYIFTTWKYKMKDEGKDYIMPEDMEDRAHEATVHHVKTNSHHPESHSDVKDPINKDNRDGVAELIDATSMPELDLAEMERAW
jgi:hypothetical protein